MTGRWISDEEWLTATSVWRIRLLRLLFPRRWWVQVRGKVYILRDPTQRESE